jgi:hypothetical protein
MPSADGAPGDPPSDDDVAPSTFHGDGNGEQPHVYGDSLPRALLARSTSEGLRIAGVTAPVDVDPLYPPAGNSPRPKPFLGSSVTFTPGAHAQLPAVLGGSAARSAFDLDASGLAATLALVRAHPPRQDLSSSLIAEDLGFALPVAPPNVSLPRPPPSPRPVVVPDRRGSRLRHPSLPRRHRASGCRPLPPMSRGSPLLPQEAHPKEGYSQTAHPTHALRRWGSRRPTFRR